MDSRSHGVLINAAGFIYASLGFSLSVLAALLSIFHRRKKEDATTIPFHTMPAPSSRGRRPVRDAPPTVATEKAVIPPLPSSPVKIQQLPPENVRTNLRRSVSAHELRRSKSMVPIITVDYFGSPDSPHRVTSAEVVVIDSPKTTSPKDAEPAVRPFVISPPSSPPASISSTSSESSSKHDRSGFRIFHPKHWGKDKSKKIERRQSSPHLCPMPGLCPSRTHKPTTSDGMISSTAPANRDGVKQRSRSVLRKMPSLPAHEKHCVNTSPRKSEKKRSQTLRTHPYEAPYFAMPPLPPLPTPAQIETMTPISRSRNIDKKHSKPRLPTQ